MKIFLDSGNIEEIRVWEPKVDGFTTNPTLMRKSSVENYTKFAKGVLTITDKPVSFEVFADDFKEMETQAKEISSWGENVYVKIPIMNTEGKYSYKLIERLLNNGIKVNVTAVMHEDQVMNLPIESKMPFIVSVFAGRIADIGVSPERTVEVIKSRMPDNCEVLWASPREVFNIYQAEQAGADIITCTPEIIEKYHKMKGRDLIELSKETVEMFYKDGQGYSL